MTNKTIGGCVWIPCSCKVYNFGIIFIYLFYQDIIVDKDKQLFSLNLSFLQTISNILNILQENQGLFNYIF